MCDKLRIAREEFLSMMADATWDTDTDLNAHDVPVTHHMLRISESSLMSLVEALELKCRMYDDARTVIERALKEP